MVSSSRERKRSAALQYEKLQLLRSITNSHALNKASIIMDASKYIQELKQQVERLNQEIMMISTSSQTSTHQNTSLPKVTVESVEKQGFFVKVFSAKSCPDLLVFILESFEEMGLNVLEARVTSTADTFQFQATVAGDQHGQTVDAQAVKMAMGQAIKNWRESNYPM